MTGRHQGQYRSPEGPDNTLHFLVKILASCVKILASCATRHDGFGHLLEIV